MITSKLLYVGLVALVYLLIRKFRAARHAAAFCAANGCKPAPTVKQSKLLPGLDGTVSLLKWIKEKRFLEEFQKLFDKYGDTFEMNVMGVRKIYTMNPENSKAMLVTKSDDFEISYYRLKAFREYVGDAVQASVGETWSHGRARLRPAFSKAQIANLDCYEEHIQHLIQLIPGDGSTVDMQDLFFRFTMDVSSDILFGESLYTLRAEMTDEIKAFQEAYDYTGRAVIKRASLGPFMDFLPDKKFEKSALLMRQYIQSYVDKGLKDRELHLAGKYPEKSNNRYIFMHELVKDTSDRTVLEQGLVGVLVAGRNTTAALLSHIFFTLARNPRPLQVLRDEIAQLNGKAPTYEELKKLTYLYAVMDETLRIYPSVMFSDREAKRDTFLPSGGGPDGKSPLFVPKGQNVNVALHPMNHDKAVWGPDVEEFRPERWSEKKRSEIRFAPFGAGPRICPGQLLALTETAYTTCRLLQTYSKLESRDSEPWCEDFGVVLRLGRGAKVSLRN